MIAVSSFRPHVEDPVYAANQIRAKRTWATCFEEVHYFGDYESQLDGPIGYTTRFIPCEPWPRIKTIALHCAFQLTRDYIAVINADIVVSSLLQQVEKKMKRMNLPAATSYRFEFDPKEHLISRYDVVRKKEDRGMDVFIATPRVWMDVAKNVPDYLRMGHQTWDTWVCGFFCSRLGNGFLQFTDERVIFHPKHEGRKTPFQAEIRNDDPCFTLATRPGPMPPL